MQQKQIYINNQPTYYYIDENGKLFNQKTNNYYKGSVDGGYLRYDLKWNQKRFNFSAHKLVAENFIPNPNNLPVVNHKDGNKLNNNINNLEWVSYSENNLHAYQNNLREKTNSINQRQKYIEDLPGEKWKQYLDTTFEISNLGRIKNNKTNNILKGKITGKGYVEWNLSISGKKKSYLAHRLVYQTFKGDIKDGYVINHKDGNKTNNNLDNLEEVLPSENILHSFYSIGHKNVKRVGKFSKEGILLDSYESCAEAARQNPGCYPNNISNACNGKLKSHHGFIWKYLE